MTRMHVPLAALFLALAGCSSDGVPAAPSASPTSTTTDKALLPSAPPGVDEYAQRACLKLVEAQNDSSIYIQPLRDVADLAMLSAVNEIARTGVVLDERVKLAEAARARSMKERGNPVQQAEVELEAQAEAEDASFKLTAACVNAGLISSSEIPAD
ncbi:hypothetical protein FXF50_12210 [Micromonospora sp. AP08]|uniref:hypothetical protein n=1 Tax=Micromonospora sp. AP08 TaxID=2604467 RepID=UPI0011D58E9E|nr:hypothetical protein [Micromonospora sp. AP08]TYB37691.1 hypothetical protein FXF50_12210 [Micromonospora sp. AP08]